jgi:3alpha(or 20beta)-hydroxysteroid dehydrogenase
MNEGQVPTGEGNFPMAAPGRIGAPNEIAEAGSFLISDAACYTSGVGPRPGVLSF